VSNVVADGGVSTNFACLFSYCPTEHTYELQKDGTSKSGKYGNLLVRLQLLEGQSEAVEEPGQSRENQEHGQSSNDRPDEPKLPLEDQVIDLFDEADHSAAKLSNVKGISVVENITDTVNTSTTIEHSDGFALVCGYVEQLMTIGDVVSKVGTELAATRPSLLTPAQLCFSDTPVGKPRMEYLERHSEGSSEISFIPDPFVSTFKAEIMSQSLIAQVHRDQKVQSLWETAADMLAFLKDTKLVIDEILVPIVSDMMKQIYHCAIFVREYSGGGFFSQSLRKRIFLVKVVLTHFGMIQNALRRTY
jgi:hypothetical protein